MAWVLKQISIRKLGGKSMCHSNTFISWSMKLIHSQAGHPSEDNWDSWEYGSFPFSNPNANKPNHEEPGNTISSKDCRGTIECPPVWNSMTITDVESSITKLEQFILPQRLQKLSEVLQRRANSVKFVFENPSNPNNVWAALRTLDSFGVQHVDIILDTEKYVANWRKQYLTAAMGSQKWLSINQFGNTNDCIEKLRVEGFRIIATDVNAAAVPLDQIVLRPPSIVGMQASQRRATTDVTSMLTIPITAITTERPPKIAIIMGNELKGISNTLKQAQLEYVYIPMRGFAESLNLSVAVAVICSHLNSVGVFNDGVMSDEEKRRLYLMWLIRSLSITSESSLKHYVK